MLKKWRIHTFRGMEFTEVNEAQDYEKNKMINLKKICYLLLIISVLSGIFTVVCFGRELRGNNVSNIKKVVNSNASIGKAYFEEIFSERISIWRYLLRGFRTGS